MRSEHFLIFYRKKTKSSIFSNENSLNIFVELFTPLIEMHKVNANEMFCMLNAHKFHLVMEVYKVLIFYRVCLWGNY